jgi:hypothetical protein
MTASYTPDGDGQEKLTGNFPFPRAGNYGQCDNFKAMAFMEQTSNSCIQHVDPEADCGADSLSFINKKLYDKLTPHASHGSTSGTVQMDTTSSTDTVLG